MGEKTPRWENELWSYLSRGDGIHCPVYESCRRRLHGTWCLSDNRDYYKARNEFLDDNDLADPSSIRFNPRSCPESGRIFQLVTRLATRYRVEAGIDRLPVPANLITQTDDNLPIEVRQVPLKAYHGAVWRLSDCWIVQLNSNDTSVRQRFTLYHEIFHILAHCKAIPVFKKTSCGQEGSFNELLADHFAAVILMPRDLVAERWPQVKDLSQMATTFDVPRSVMWLALRTYGLISSNSTN